MSREQRPRRQPPAVSSSMNSTLSIIVAVAALLLGFFILRDIRSGGSTSAGTDQQQVIDETTIPEAVMPVETTAAPIVLTAFKVQIANASKVAGSAGQLTVELQGRGFIVIPAKNASEITPKQTTTVVYFLAGSEAAAAAIAAQLGGVATAPMPTPIPIETGSLGEASVLILLGTDLAGKPLSSPIPTVPAAVVTTTSTP